jgi:hypothetical protein
MESNYKNGLKSLKSIYFYVKKNLTSVNYTTNNISGYISK